MQHKWHKEIIAWANGIEIECLNTDTGEWQVVKHPYWYDDYEYRVKPEPPKPVYMYVYQDPHVTSFKDAYFVSMFDTEKMGKSGYTCITKFKVEGT